MSSAIVMSSAEKIQIEISGINVSKAELEVYFQERKCDYGTGEVTVTILEDRRAIITIEGITQESKGKLTYRSVANSNKLRIS